MTAYMSAGHELDHTPAGVAADPRPVMMMGDEPADDSADAARYRWLRARLLAADFDYMGEGIPALVFELPPRCAVSADCDATIDEAMKAAA